MNINNEAEIKKDFFAKARDKVLSSFQMSLF